MNLEDLIKPESILCNIDVKSKKRALEMLADLLATQLDTGDDPALSIFQLLVEREKLGSTGLGHGVALPHARSSLAERAVAAFIKLPDGIDFDSPDHRKTDLIFALMVPEGGTEQHLQILAFLAAMFSDDKLSNELRNAGNADELYQKLIHWQLPSRQAC